jgi:Fe-S cluster assembly iron-binding protein IscA
VILLGNGKAA